MTGWREALAPFAAFLLLACTPTRNNTGAFSIKYSVQGPRTGLSDLMERAMNDCANMILSSGTHDPKRCVGFLRDRNADLPDECSGFFWHPTVVAFPVCRMIQQDVRAHNAVISGAMSCHFELLFTGVLELSSSSELCVPPSLSRRAEACQIALRRHTSIVVVNGTFSEP